MKWSCLARRVADHQRDRGGAAAGPIARVTWAADAPAAPGASTRYTGACGSGSYRLGAARLPQATIVSGLAAEALTRT